MPIRSEAPHISFNKQIKNICYDTDSLSNNISLYSIQDKSQTVCGVEILFGGGKIDELKKGASFFSTNLLKAGIKGYDSHQINNFFELRGAFVQLQSGLDINSLSLYCLSSKLKETLPFFLNLFNEPIFPDEKLAQLASRKEQELDINLQKSSYWSSKLIKEALFGNHPYGQVLEKEDFQSITPSNLKDHWSSFSLNQIKFITAAGDFDKAFLKSAIETILEKQSKKVANAVKGAFSTEPSNTTKTLLNSKQTSLKISFQTINYLHPHYPTLSLANTVFGGYFGSRLMQSIREDKGLTYGIGSSIQHLKKSSYIQISADIKMGAGNEVLELIKVELDKIHNNKISDTELNKVKHYLIGEYRSSNQTIFDRINRVKFLKINNLSNSYFANHFDSILSVEADQIREVSKVQYNPSLFKSVLVE
ncbi:MAG: insulinase family protein [Cyclobacteriaceae bacterium]|nr:insulinase family protein [Cyclobacteriaceae bacterium]